MKIGRNDKCPCGSGKKYKQCCLSKDDKIKQNEREQRKIDLDNDFALGEQLVKKLDSQLNQ